MPIAADVLKLIKTRFAGRDELIERAFRQDVTFRSLCKDYRDCHRALARLRRDDSAHAALRRAEYVELLDELGCEIRSWLEMQDIR